MKPEPQVLLIDADDTLWETNVNFERVLANYCRLLTPLGYAEAHIRREVDRAERASIQRRGYGAANFLQTLEEVYLELAGARARPPHREQIRRFARILLDEPLRLLPGVAETLAYLAARHRLLLFTKGNRAEQTAKVDSSGVGHFFEAREIVAEKNEAAYSELVRRRGLPAGSVWMVGNSPRWDINPALAAGLNAVLIPARHAWEYEQEELRAGPGRLLVLKSFSELRQYF